MCGRKRSLVSESYRPTLLKKLAIVSTAERYALEIEIFTLCRGSTFRFRIAARKKGVSSSPYAGSLEALSFSTQLAISCRSVNRP